MTHSVTLCDLCGKAVANGSNRLEKVEGIGIELFQSVDCGGWGSKRELKGFSGEVCVKCYEEFSIIADGVRQWIQARGGARTPIITVTERDVSFVQADEPPPNGRKAPILRRLLHLL